MNHDYCVALAVVGGWLAGILTARAIYRPARIRQHLVGPGAPTTTGPLIADTDESHEERCRRCGQWWWWTLSCPRCRKPDWKRNIQKRLLARGGR